MNASFQCEWHEVTPEYLIRLEKRRQDKYNSGRTKETRGRGGTRNG
jgi:hypothetical protein